MQSQVLSRALRGFAVPLLAVAAVSGHAGVASAAGVQAGSFSQTEFDLGDVPIESAKSVGVTLRSTGTAPLQPGSVQPGPNGYETLLFANGDAPIAPGSSRRYYLAADPMTLGPVDTTISLEYGGADGPLKTATIHVKYNAVPQPVLPYAHFDLRLNDEGWNDFLFSNTSLRPIGGATGALPGKFVFKVASGTVSATNTGVLASDGGFEIKHTGTVNWSKLGVDLTRRRLTAVLATGGKRVDVADLPYVGDNYDLEGHLVTYASVALNATSAKQLNTVGVRPKVTAGQTIGWIEILKP